MQPEPPPEIPDYRLLKCIGRGSYGTVWLARNIMGSFRAVKVVHRRAFTDQKPFERELSGIRKFEPISRSYQGFIDVLHIGINEPLGYFYYVMELGDDEHSGQAIHPEDYSPRTLDKEMTHRDRMPFQECLALGLELTKALAELHKHGLVHRDVKPANIIFINGVPKLADIGLVAEAEAAPSFVGTAGFIPPEGPGKPQADIYSLGKVLYETSTGKDRQEFPNLPTQLESMPESGSFLELNEVLLQACQSDPQKRYQTAWAMHADLVVLANGKSVKRLRTLERRFANLKRAGVAFTVLFALLGVIFHQVYRERRAVREAHRRQDIVSGTAAVASGELYLALPFFADLLKVDAGDPWNQKAARLQFASALALGPKLNEIWFEDHPIANGEFSPDGKQVLVALELGDVKIYDIKTGAVRLLPLHPDYLMSAGYNRDGTMIVTTEKDGWVEIWNAATLERQHRFHDPSRSLKARFNPDGRRLVTADGDGTTRVWNLQTEKIELSLPGEEVIRFADFSPDGNLIVTCSQDHTAHLWNATNGSPVGPTLNQKSWVYYAAFSPDGKKFATASGDHKVKVWNTATGQLISPELFHDDAVMTVKFSPDGRLILTSCLDGTIRLWNAEDYQPWGPASIIRQGQRVVDASFDPEGRRILAACTDGSLRLWDLAGGLLPTLVPASSFSRDGALSLQITDGTVTVKSTQKPETTKSIAPEFSAVLADFNRNGRYFFTASSIRTGAAGTNRLIQIWDSSSAKPVAPSIRVPNSFSRAAISDDGNFVVLSKSTNAQIWEIKTGKPVGPSIHLKNIVKQSFFSLDGNQVLLVAGKEIQVLDVRTGVPLFPPFQHKQPVAHAELSPDGLRLASSCSDPSFDPGYAQIWDLQTGKPSGPQFNHRDGVPYVTYSPDGKYLATAGEDFVAVIWEIATARQLTVLKHPEKIMTVAFSPDGKWIVTTCSDGTARIWNVQSGDPLTPPLRHEAVLRDARFLSDGRGIVTTGRQEDHYVWNLAMEDMPLNDMKKLAGLLSGDTMLPPAGSPKMAWPELKGKYPASFTVSPSGIDIWHEYQAEEAELDGAWSAVAFHLRNRLAENRTPDCLQRIATAEQHIKNGN